MNSTLQAFLAEYDQERSRIEIPEPGYRVERLSRNGHVYLVRMIGPGAQPEMNAVLFSDFRGWTLNEVRSAIEGEVRFFREIDHGFEWKHYDHDSPPELPALLKEFGAKPNDSESLLVAEPALWKPSAQPIQGRIHELNRPDEFFGLIKVQEAVWQQDFAWLRDTLVAEKSAFPDSLRIYSVVVDGEAVSTGWIRLKGSIAHLHGGSTLAEHRGNGFFRALVDLRMRQAKEAGCRYVAVDATEMSRPVLERIGFVAASRTTPYHFHRVRNR